MPINSSSTNPLVYKIISKRTFTRVSISKKRGINKDTVAEIVKQALRIDGEPDAYIILYAVH